MSHTPVAEGILDVVNDPEYRRVLSEALQEIRDNVARMGRDEALKSAGHMNYLLSMVRPDIVATMATIVMFDLAETTNPQKEATPAVQA